ncbi:dihydrofolate reductase family protein, partial [Acinetobacter baumannii]
PYIILKWAQTADRFIGNIHHQRLKISNDVVNKLVHEWRAEVGAILVGTNTVMKDNPHLTNRSGVGKNPVRLIIDKKRVIPKTA